MIEALGQAFKADGGVWPKRGVSPTDGVQVPALTAAGVPN